jgi:uncharacterized cofD-like protein
MPKSSRVSSLRKNALKEPLRVVAIGGGTGLSTLLAGLKHHAASAGKRVAGTAAATLDITAVVTVTDDGGSSGRLRREFDILPPGDIRNCMAALSEDSALLSQLFQYRFDTGRGLKGHSFGNLFLTALHQITGDFAHAVKLSSEILAIRGRIFPATSADVRLEAILDDGSIIQGESNISKSRQPIRTIHMVPRDCRPLPETLQAIKEADLITLGPGSLYTSVIPNLLVEGIPEAISKSPALKIYFVNLMWQPGETINFKASHHVQALNDHSGRSLIDCVVLNDTPIPAKLARRYAKAHVRPVENDYETLRSLGIKVVTANLVGAQVDSSRIRHDPHALAEVVIDLAGRSRALQFKKTVLHDLVQDE